MSNAAFDRPIVNQLEKPISTDVNLVAAYAMNTLTELLRCQNRVRGGNLIASGLSGASGSGLAADIGRGFVGDGFMPYWSSGMQLKLRAGLGFYTNSAAIQRSIGSVSGLDDVSMWQPLVIQQDQTLTVPPNTSGAARIDLIEVRVARRQTNPAETYTLAPTTGAFGSGQLNKTLTYALDDDIGVFDETGPSTTAIGYRVGVLPDDAPTVSPGYIAIGYVYVPDGTTSTLSDAAVYDYRRILLGSGLPITVRVAFNGGASGGLLDSATIVHAPPGIEVAVVDDAASAYAGFSVYVFAGDSATASAYLPARLLTIGSHGDSGTTTSFLVLNQVSGPIADRVDATDVTNLADTGIVSPKALSKVESFQWRWKVSYQVQVQASGTTNHTVPASSTMTVQLMLLPKGGY